MRRTKVMGLLGLGVLLLVLPVVPVRAEPGVHADDVRPHGRAQSVERRPAIASFEGRLLDLSEDWGEARACLVWRQGGVLECFRSPEALDARAAKLSPQRAEREAATASVASYSYSCSSSLRLYDYNWYGGRQLSFWDRGFWQNLRDYGFEDRTSSYAVGGCYAHLAEHADGAGWWYPGPTYPYAGEPVMYASWQNTISSIYVE